MSELDDTATNSGTGTARRGKVAAAKTSARKAIDTTKAKASETLANGKERASRSYASGKAKASEAYESAQAGVRRARERTTREVEDNPLAFLIGGLAVGALAGTLLPRTRQETRTLGAAGRRINKTATSAVKAAKTAGLDKIESLGVKDVAKAQVTGLLKSITEAASEAGSAAARTVTKPKRRTPPAPSAGGAGTDQI